jgi:hypothetical protein
MDDLQRNLRRAAELFDPVRPGPVRLAAVAYALRIPGADLAELTFDSCTAPIPVRSGGTVPRLLTFGTEDTTVDVELTSSGRGLTLVGQLTPGRSAEVLLRGPHPAVTTADRLGRFRLDTVPYGPFARAVWAGTRVPVTTDWISL